MKNKNKLLIPTVISLPWVITFLTIFLLTFNYKNGLSNFLFLTSASITYSFIITSPLFLLWQTKPLIPQIILKPLLVLIGIVLTATLFSSYKLYSMYGFHINSFVINLLFTPGGIESLGANQSFFINITLGLCLYALLYSLLIIALEKSKARIPSKPVFVAFTFLIAFMTQGIFYAYSHFNGYAPVLVSASKIPLFQPITSTKLLLSFGFTQNKKTPSYKLSGGALNYPVKPIKIKSPTKYNIIWLTAESWRNDMLTPEIMPQTYAFASKNQNFLNHYSGGNGTRMGMFSMFSGLYGNYWFDFLNERKSPVFMNTIIKQNYSIKAFTSAHFTYPEFDKTIFSRLTEDQMQENSTGISWQRDRANVDDLITFIDSQNNPFFTFMFFESTHAPYQFPPESIIRKDFLEDFDYSTVDIKENISKIKNRYINASRHLDSQIGKVLQHLKEKSLLDNSIVIITGDHGEEFFEKNHWGHNSSFVQEQIRVPLVLHIPKNKPSVVTKMSSHLDITPTILPLLGVTNPHTDYSHGKNLLSPNYQREYVVVADWFGVGIIGHDMKLNLSLESRETQQSITTLDDKAISNVNTTISTYYMNKFIRSNAHFLQ